MAMIVLRKSLLLLAVAVDVSLAWSPQPNKYHIQLPTPTSKGKTTQVSLYPSNGPVVVLSGPEIRAMNKSKGPHSGHPVIVAMYASWCPHCWHLVPLWVDFAHAYGGQKDKIEVGSVNCADDANFNTCDDAGVKGYPHIQCYGCPVSSLCPKPGCKVTVGFAITPGLSIPQWLGNWVTNATKGEVKPTHPQLLEGFEPKDHQVDLQGPPGDPGFVPSGMTPAEKRAQDAMRGFLTALHSRNDRAVAVKAVDFMKTLFLTQCCKKSGMPNAYRTTPILDLLALETSLAGPNVNVREVVRNYAAVHGIHELGNQDIYAEFKSGMLSTKGEDSYQMCTTYTCSFWQFLHMTTAAAAYFAAAGSPRLSPGKVMEFTRFFVDEFLTCEQCRHHFLWSFDDAKCQFDRCEVDQQSDWPGLVLWLWRVHEGVNLRTAARDNAPVDRRWPSYEDCMGCWRPLAFGEKSKVNHFDMVNIGYHSKLLNSPFNLPKVYNFIVAQYVGWDSTGITAIDGKVMRKWEVEQLLLPPEDQTHMSKTAMWWTFSTVATAGIVASLSLWCRTKGSQRRSGFSDEDLETVDACE